MNAPISDYPPEVSGLIRRYKTVMGAERAARVQTGAFNKIRNGKRVYDDGLRQRILFAIEQFDATPKETEEMAQVFEIPDKCPDILADLLKRTASKTKTKKILRCGDIVLNAVMNGKEPLPADWEVKIKGELGLAVLPSHIIPPASEVAANGAVPPFVAWDGKSKGNVKILPWGKAKGRTIKNVPLPIAQLVEKHGKVAAAAQAMGMTGGALMNWMDDEKPFTLERQQRVHAAMHGMPAGGRNELGDSFDKYSLGLAVCILKGPAYDLVNSVAEILNGRLVFKKNTSGGWIIIYRMQTEDLPKFKKLAMRDCNEIVCP